VLDPSTAPGKFDADTVRAVVGEHLPKVEGLRRRVVDLPFPFSIPHWTISRTVEVDLHHHIRRADLPPGADLHALAQLTARVAERSLPRDKPLWEMLVAEGSSVVRTCWRRSPTSPPRCHARSKS